MGGSGECPTRSEVSTCISVITDDDIFFFLILYILYYAAALAEDLNPTPIISFNEALQYFQTTDLGDLLVKNFTHLDFLLLFIYLFILTRIICIRGC